MLGAGVPEPLRYCSLGERRDRDTGLRVPSLRPLKPLAFSGRLAQIIELAMARYAFDEVRAALHKHWGLSLHRGGELTDLGRDGRWDVCYSKTGYVVGGNLPGLGHGYRRFGSLAAVVRCCDLEAVIAKARA